MKTTLWLLALLLAGCGKKASPPPTSNAAQNSTAAPADGDVSATLTRLTQAVRKYAAENRRAPKSISEVVAAGYLQEMPAAPPGKQFVIDNQLRVTLQ
jgi:hypothetical protein